MLAQRPTRYEWESWDSNPRQLAAEHLLWVPPLTVSWVAAVRRDGAALGGQKAPWESTEPGLKLRLEGECSEKQQLEVNF